jgi:hypothetical protein
LIAQDARSDLRILRNNQESSSKWKKVGVKNWVKNVNKKNNIGNQIDDHLARRHFSENS